MRIKIVSAFLILQVALASFLFSQETPKASWIFNTNAHYGVLLPEYGFLSYLTEDYIQGFELALSRQSAGNTVWERIYSFPGLGATFFYSSLGNDRVFGKQFAFFPHYTIHFIEKEKFAFDYSIGCGASYVTSKFDVFNNYENLSVGSNWNIFFNFKLQVKYKITNGLFANAGIAFNHLSNANLSEPNVGLNYTTGFVGLSYETGKFNERNRETVEPLKPFYEQNLIVNGGYKHTRTFESFSYPALSLSYDLKRRMGYKIALGIGADFFYDSSTEPQMIRLNKTFQTSNAYTTGIHLMQEFIYDRLSLIIQEGFYLGLTEKLNNYVMYNRAIVRYKFNKHLFASVSMKSHVFILDFPELGLGYYW